MDSAANSALTSSQASRSATPLPVQPQVNPYRIPRFWRGYLLGGLSAAGAYGLYKLGSFIKDQFSNKFNRHYIPSISPYQALPTPDPKPTPYKRQNLKIHENRHY